MILLDKLQLIENLMDWGVGMCDSIEMVGVKPELYKRTLDILEDEIVRALN